MASIEPALDRARETHVILTLSLSAPWLRVHTQPCFTFGFPFSAQAMRHSVGESKRNEVNRAFLLPMWQAIRSKANVCVRIEELQFGHHLSVILDDVSDGRSFKERRSLVRRISKRSWPAELMFPRKQSRVSA